MEQHDIPFASQAVPFSQMIASGEIPNKYLTSDYVAQQFIERLVHYVLSVPDKSFTMAELGKLLEGMDPDHQIYFFKKLKKTSPESLKNFAPLYYGFMAEFEPLLFT